MRRSYKQLPGSLNVHYQDRLDFIAQADSMACSLYDLHRLPISIDDVRAACESQGITAPHPRLWSNVFLPSAWNAVGTVRATHPGAHSRKVTLWVRKPYKA